MAKTIEFADQVQQINPEQRRVRIVNTVEVTEETSLAQIEAEIGAIDNQITQLETRKAELAAKRQDICDELEINLE